jgi:membrane protein implicated in regulation of membrane protease activity
VKAAIEFLLVGRTPLGSSVRGVLIAVLIMLFWALFLDRFWTLVTVSVITALAIVVAAHLFSRRDDHTSAPLGSGTPPHA